MKLILALDQGTSSCRSIVFDKKGKIRGISQKEITQIYPSPGWVEHNPTEIFEIQKYTVEELLKKNHISPSQIVACGITNQRETTVIWDKTTGKPIHNAIVWQCRRTTDICKTFQEHQSIIKEKQRNLNFFINSALIQNFF